MSRKTAAVVSVLGSAAIAITGLTAQASAAAPAPAAAPQAAAPQAAAAAAKPYFRVAWKNGKKVSTFYMARSTGAVAKKCIPYARARVEITENGGTETMRVTAWGLPRKTGFDFFVLQVPEFPFGLSWYQGDLESDKYGVARAAYVGRFNKETFTVAVGTPAPAPVTHKGDANTNPVTRPVHQYHLGFWFNSPADAAKAGCGATVTPFNGEHNAGVQAMNTRQFPIGAGPLSRIG